MAHASPFSRNGRAMAPMVAAVALLGVLQALPPDWHALLRYDRQALLQGELWRLWTGHLVHLGWAHWALNAAGLMLCGVLADGAPRAGVLLRRACFLGLGISALFLLLVPTLAYYVGLSGVLYGLFVLALWPGARRVDPIAIAALATIAAWLCGQWILGPDRREMELIGGPIIVQAHVFGVVCAALLLVARTHLRRK